MNKFFLKSEIEYNTDSNDAYPNDQLKQHKSFVDSL